MHSISDKKFEQTVPCLARCFVIACLRRRLPILVKGEPSTCLPSCTRYPIYQTNPHTTPSPSQLSFSLFHINPMPTHTYPSHPTSFPSHTLSLPNCISISPPHSLLPLPPPDLLLPRRPEQLILHLWHLLVLHTDWNASFLFLEDFRDPREDVEELVFCESLIRLCEEVN